MQKIAWFHNGREILKNKTSCAILRLIWYQTLSFYVSKLDLNILPTSLLCLRLMVTDAAKMDTLWISNEIPLSTSRWWVGLSASCLTPKCSHGFDLLCPDGKENMCRLTMTCNPPIYITGGTTRFPLGNTAVVTNSWLESKWQIASTKGINEIHGNFILNM